MEKDEIIILNSEARNDPKRLNLNLVKDDIPKNGEIGKHLDGSFIQHPRIIEPKTSVIQMTYNSKMNSDDIFHPRANIVSVQEKDPLIETETEEDTIANLDLLATMLGEPPRKKSVWDFFDLVVKNMPLAVHIKESSRAKSLVHARNVEESEPRDILDHPSNIKTKVKTRIVTKKKTPNSRMAKGKQKTAPKIIQSELDLPVRQSQTAISNFFEIPSNNDMWQYEVNNNMPICPSVNIDPQQYEMPFMVPESENTTIIKGSPDLSIKSSQWGNFPTQESHSLKNHTICRTQNMKTANKEGLHTIKWLFRCDDCEKTFPEAWRLKKHRMIHTGEKPFVCDVCEKSFTQSHHLKEHIMNHHDGLKPFMCYYCAQEFSTRRILKSHEIIHTGERPFQCDVCKEAFGQHGDLWKHKQIHQRNILAEEPVRMSVVADCEISVLPESSRLFVKFLPN